MGWKDPFASSAATHRQQRYCRIMRSDTIYTPEIIVNGKHAVVGSKRSDVNAAIQQAEQEILSRSVPDIVVTQQDRSDASKLVLTVQVPVVRHDVAAVGSPITTLLVAVVRDDYVVNVKRGENAGRQLQHDRVVRSWTEVALLRQDLESNSLEAATTTATLDLPADIDDGPSHVIIVAQDPQTLHVASSLQISLPEAGQILA